jgi:hypothetical protein
MTSNCCRSKKQGDVGSGAVCAQGAVDRCLSPLGVNGRLEVFVHGQDNHLWHIWQVRPNSDWSRWEDMSIRGTPEIQVAGDPAVGRAADGRLEVFTTGDDNHLWLRFQVHSN